MKITLVQANLAWEQPSVNRENLLRLIDNETETDLVLLPEMFTSGFTMNASSLAEKYEGSETVRWMKALSAERGFAIAGSLIVEEGGRYFNRLLFVRPEGQVSHYDKAHLFSIYGEDQSFTRGTAKLIESYKGFNISFQVCYDLRFPVWARNRDNEYDLLVNVANWPESRRTVWSTLLAARAIENQCYVAGVNRVGADNSGTFYSGDSMVIGPRGKVLASVTPFKEGIISSTVSAEELNEFRSKFPVWKDADPFALL